MIVIRHGEEVERAHLQRIFAEAVANAAGYSEEQRKVWAGDISAAEWERRHGGKEFWVAVSGDDVVGFIDWQVGVDKKEKEALIDMLYVLPAYQRRGVGQRLIAAVAASAQNIETRKLSRLYTNASFMARGCFAGAGFTLLRENKVERAGVELINYEMELFLSVS